MGGFLSFFVCVFRLGPGERKKRGKERHLPRDSLESRRRTKERKKERKDLIFGRPRSSLSYSNHTLI